jgi:hypothetical protein
VPPARRAGHVAKLGLPRSPSVITGDPVASSSAKQPSEVVVLSLADHRQARPPALELLLGTSSNITRFPVAPSPITTSPRRPGTA